MNAIAVIGLPVETESGRALGRVVGVQVDPDAHAVQQYEIERGSLLTRLAVGAAAELLVSPTQVVSVTAEKMVVVDLLASQPAVEQATAAE